MKILSLPLLLSLVLAGCTSESVTSTVDAASNAAKGASGMATEVAGKMLDQVKTTLAGITNADGAKTAAASLTTLVPKLGDALKGLTGAWPANLTATADGIREQITRLSGMADIKSALGGVLDQITKLLPAKK